MSSDSSDYVRWTQQSRSWGLLKRLEGTCRDAGEDGGSEDSGSKDQDMGGLGAQAEPTH